MYTVYFALNRTNGKAYAGYTVRKVSKRFTNHCSAAMRGSQCRFHNAIRKYGKESFDVIATWQGDNREEAIRREIDLIAGMKLQDPRFGYNLTAGGEGSFGFKHTRKWSHTPEDCLGISIRMRGNKHSLGHKNSLGKHKPFSAETRRRQSEAAKKRGNNRGKWNQQNEQ